MTTQVDLRRAASEAVIKILDDPTFAWDTVDEIVDTLRKIFTETPVAGKRCIILGSVNGEGFRHCILLQTPDSGGLSILTDDTQVMVYGQIEEQNYKPARWHHFPARNVIRYEVEAA